MILIKKPVDCRPIVDAFMDAWSKSHSASDRLPKLGLTRHLYVAASQKEAEERGMFGFRGWYRSHSAMWKRFELFARRGGRNALHAKQGADFWHTGVRQDGTSAAAR